MLLVFVTDPMGQFAHYSLLVAIKCHKINMTHTDPHIWMYVVCVPVHVSTDTVVHSYEHEQGQIGEHVHHHGHLHGDNMNM